MNQSLRDLCELQIENERIIRGVSFLEDGNVIKVGALFYTMGKATADPEKIRASKEILKRKTGIFSNFRGLLKFAIQVKMASEPDPETYLDHVLEIYNKLAAGRILPGEILAMTAMTVYDQLDGRDADSAVAAIREVYAKIKQKHRFLTDENDLSYVALLVLSGKDVDQAVEEVESLYAALKERFRIPSDTAQSVALILSMSKKPVEQKAENFIGLYKALKEAKHATSKQKVMSVYAAFADLDISRDLLVEEIGEAEEWLGHQKGYGLLSSSDVRRVMAATLVLQHHGEQGAVAVQTEASAVASQVIAEDVIFTMIMMIAVSASISSAASRS